MIKIPGCKKSIGGEEIFVIAEIGKGFIQTKEDKSVEEYLENTKKLIDAAVEAGVDAVKLQTHELEDEQLDIEVVSPHFTGSDRYSWVKRNTEATPFETFWVPLKEYCKEKDIFFFSTPMSRKAAQKLTKLGVDLWKVGSGDVQDYVLLDYLVETKKPIIISSGMVSLAELDEVILYLRGKEVPLVVLYCISQYPCPQEEFNLATIEYLTEKYPDVVFGFSDHSVGSFEVDLAAVKLGTKVIEKHFSLDRGLWGSDHKVSMLPNEMRSMVEALKNKEYESVDATPYYGEKEKELEGAYNIFRPYYNKALMAGMDIEAGVVLTKEMIYAMRPVMYAGGLPSNRLNEVVGKITCTNLKKYDPITTSVLE